MLNLKPLIAVILLGLGAAACSPDAERAATPAPVGEGVEIINELMKAFNAHDPDAMRALWHEDVIWYEIAGGGMSPITTSAQQLYDELVAYFESYPSVSSSIEHLTINGRYVTAVERPVWEEAGERKSQASNVVYEIIDGKVKRFWYFPPQ